jgi:hypothetical protein
MAAVVQIWSSGRQLPPDPVKPAGGLGWCAERACRRGNAVLVGHVGVGRRRLDPGSWPSMRVVGDSIPFWLGSLAAVRSRSSRYRGALALGRGVLRAVVLLAGPAAA